VVEGDDVGGAFVLQEAPVNLAHFVRADEVEAEFDAGGVEMVLQEPADEGAGESRLDAAPGMAVAEGEDERARLGAGLAGARGGVSAFRFPLSAWFFHASFWRRPRCSS